MKKVILASLLSFFACCLFAQQIDFVNTYIELKQSVIDYREDGIPGCIRNGVMINPSPSELKVGDVFIDVDGNARQVTSIQRDGSELFIDTVQPDLSLVINYVDIPEQTINFTEDNFLPETLPGGEVSSISPVSSSRASAPFGSATKFEKVFKYQNDKISVKLGGKVENSGALTISVRLPYIKRWRHHDGYIAGSFDFSQSVECHVGVSMDLEKKIGTKKEKVSPDKKLIYGFGTSGSSVSAGLGLYFQPVLEGSLELTIPLTAEISGSVSAGCALGGLIIPYPKDAYRSGSSNFVVSISPSLEASGKLTAKFSVGSVVSVFGISVSDFDAGGGPYLKLDGSISIDAIKYDKNVGKVTFAEDGFKIAGTGEIGICGKVTGSVFQGKWSFEVLSFEYPYIKAGWDAEEGGWYWTSPFTTEAGPKTAYMPNDNLLVVDNREECRDYLMLPYRCLVPMTAVREGKTI